MDNSTGSLYSVKILLWISAIFETILFFNGNKVESVPSQKHLGLVLDCKLDFNELINKKRSKCNKIIGRMKKLSLTLSSFASQI